MDRLIYLLGTAHISEVSAQLAGQLVRDTHPNAVWNSISNALVDWPRANLPLRLLAMVVAVVAVAAKLSFLPFPIRRHHRHLLL
jgi:hypothetical protein